MGSGHVLFIDDEPALARLGELMLSPLGYRVSSFTDSRKALEAFRRNPGEYDLIITDQMMPHLNGESLARQIKEIRCEIPVILCTGHEPHQQGLEMGEIQVVEYLYKPLSKSALARSVSRSARTSAECSAGFTFA